MTETSARPAAAEAPPPAAAEPEPRATRHAYRDTLAELMQAHDRVVCLDTDTGLFTGTDFGAAAERYVNIGIAEQNLMGAGAGLAACGWIPFVNTMATFASTRAVEAVKVDIAYNLLPVRIAATHGGLSAGHLGPTHHCLEDLAIMRALAGMTVVIPADAAQTTELVHQTANLPGPVYLRLGRKATPAIPATGQPLELGLIQVLRPGTEVVIAACGPHPVLAALDAARPLAAGGVEASVLNVHTLKPFDTEGLLAAVADTALVVTAEEHWLSGGLGTTISEVLAEHAPRRVLRIGIPDTYVKIVGDHEDLLAHFGLTGPGIAETVRQALGRPPAGPDGANRAGGAA